MRDSSAVVVLSWCSATASAQSLCSIRLVTWMTTLVGLDHAPLVYGCLSRCSAGLVELNVLSV